jgi:putative ABC transport system substrate-binding protein
VKLRLVNSLNRPGGNVTGVIYLSLNLGGKRLNLLRDLVPEATTVAFLTSPGPIPRDEQSRDMTVAAQALGRQLIVLEVRSPREIGAAFSTLVERGAGALIVGVSQLIAIKFRRLLRII